MWRDEPDLFDEVGRRRLKAALDNPQVRGMRVTLHGGGWETGLVQHRKQIETAAVIGADLVVVEPESLFGENGRHVDVPVARDVIALADHHGVRVALKNGRLSTLTNAVKKSPAWASAWTPAVCTWMRHQVIRCACILMRSSIG